MKNYINGYDLKAKFNLEIEKVTKVIMQYPARKKSVDIDLQDTNGHNIDLIKPKFSDRNFAFPCIITADTINEFKENYFGLFQLIKQGGEYYFYNDHVDMMLYLYYQTQSNLSDMYRTASGGYGVTFTLNFGETDPFGNIPIVELVDGDYSVLVP
jgi:hypothetical protein